MRSLGTKTSSKIASASISSPREAIGWSWKEESGCETCSRQTSRTPGELHGISSQKLASGEGSGKATFETISSWACGPTVATILAPDTQIPSSFSLTIRSAPGITVPSIARSIWPSRVLPASSVSIRGIPRRPSADPRLRQPCGSAIGAAMMMFSSAAALDRREDVLGKLWTLLGDEMLVRGQADLGRRDHVGLASEDAERLVREVCLNPRRRASRRTAPASTRS